MALPYKWLPAFPQPTVALETFVHFPAKAVLGVSAGHRIQLAPAGEESFVQLRPLCPTGTLPASAGDADGSLGVGIACRDCRP